MEGGSGSRSEEEDKGVTCTTIFLLSPFLQGIFLTDVSHMPIL